MLDLKTKKLNYLTQFKEGQQIFAPRWSPNGQVIVFSLTKGEGRQIGLITADGKTLKVLLADGNDVRDPVFAPNGKEILFSWDRSGIFNIYSIDISSKEKKQLTNVVGGAFMPSVNKDGQLLYNDFNSQGYKIALMEKRVPVEQQQAEYLTYTHPSVYLASGDNKDIIIMIQKFQSTKPSLMV